MITPDSILYLQSQEVQYSPGAEVSFPVTNIGATAWTTTEGLFNLVQDYRGGKPRPKLDYPQFIWTEQTHPNPGLPSVNSTDSIVIPYVWIEAQDPQGSWQPLKVTPVLEGGSPSRSITETNRGLNFATIVLDATMNQIQWVAIWMMPELPRERDIPIQDNRSLRSRPLLGAIYGRRRAWESDCTTEEIRTTGNLPD